MWLLCEKCWSSYWASYYSKVPLDFSTTTLAFIMQVPLYSTQTWLRLHLSKGWPFLAWNCVKCLFLLGSYTIARRHSTSTQIRSMLGLTAQSCSTGSLEVLVGSRPIHFLPPTTYDSAESGPQRLCVSFQFLQDSLIEVKIVSHSKCLLYALHYRWEL